MDPYERSSNRRPFKKYSALFFLVLLGCVILFFSIVLIACAFVVNYSDDFEIDGTDAGIEEKVQSEFHYSQYWAGVLFIVTGILIICSGTFQLNRDLTIASVIFCIISFGVTLFVISLDGPNWRFWNSQQRLKMYWDGKSSVDCAEEIGASMNKCICTNTATNTVVKTLIYSCSNINQLSSLYGAIVGSAIIVALCCILAILVITKSLSWKRLRYSHFFRNRYAEPAYVPRERFTPPYEPEPIAMAMPMKRRRRYSTSFLELAPMPYEKRGYLTDPSPYYKRDYIPAPLPFHRREYIEGPPPVLTRGYTSRPKFYHKYPY